MDEAVTENAAIGTICYWAFIVGGVLTAVLSVLMFFCATDEYNPTINEHD
jgi:hypothetical protein